MKETLTRGESQIVFDDIKKEIDRVQRAIKDKKVGDYTIEILQAKKDSLQEHLNKLLRKGGAITEEDYNKAYIIIKAKEEKEILDLRNKARRRVVIYGLFALTAIMLGIYLIKKNK
jgi:hypothetical protein